MNPFANRLELLDERLFFPILAIGHDFWARSNFFNSDGLKDVNGMAEAVYCIYRSSQGLLYWRIPLGRNSSSIWRLKYLKQYQGYVRHAHTRWLDSLEINLFVSTIRRQLLGSILIASIPQALLGFKNFSLFIEYGQKEKGPPQRM